MTDMPNHRRWKNFFIRKDVQLPIISTNLVFLAVVAVVLIVVLLSPLYHDMLDTDQLWVQHVSGNLFLILLRRISLAMLLILVAAAAHQIILSHRFCGPLVNFGHTFEMMVNRDLSRKVHLRKKDFLKAEANWLNAVIDRLNADGHDINKNITEIDSIVNRLKNQPASAENAALIEKLSASLDACKSKLASWNLGSHP